MERNMSSSENQRSLPIVTAARMLEHMLQDLAGLDILDPPEEI